MKVLVTYVSKTGNTKKLADAIYGEIKQDKELKSLDSVNSLEGYDLTFIGFPLIGLNPHKKAKEFLEKNCKAKKIALFVTHAAPEDSKELPAWLKKCKDAAKGAKVVGIFNCQGQLSKMIKLVMTIHPDARLRKWAKEDSSQGQPDDSRLEKAKEFAKKVMKK